MQSIPHASDPGDRGPGIIAGTVVVAVLATIAVGLRVISRRLHGLSLEVDDYLIFAALVSKEYPWLHYKHNGSVVRRLIPWVRKSALQSGTVCFYTNRCQIWPGKTRRYPIPESNCQ